MLFAFVAMLVVAMITTITFTIVNAVANAIHIATLKEVKIAIFFVLTIAFPIVIRYNDGPVIASKIGGVMLLAVAQYLCLPVHPFLVHPSTTFVNHIRTFIVPFVIVIGTAIILRCHGFMPGYPPLGDTDLVISFTVVFTVFTVYLVLFGGLIRNGYSHQWANVALLATLHLIAMNPFHPNPIVTIVSALVYGACPVYAVHIAAVATAVLASKLVERVRIALVAKVKKE